VSYSLSWHQSGATVNYSESVSFDDIISAFTALQRQAHYDHLKYAIHDFRAITALRKGPVEMPLLVAHTIGAGYSNPHIHTAIVVSLEQLENLCRQYAARTPQRTQVFNTLEAAYDWLRECECIAA